MQFYSPTASHIEDQHDCQNQEEAIKADPGTGSQSEEAVDEIGKPYQANQQDILTLGGVEQFDQTRREHPGE
jgi:hypothetical protein